MGLICNQIGTVHWLLTYSVQRARELKHTLKKVKEKRVRAFSTLCEYKLSNLNLEKRVLKEEITSGTALRELKQMKLGVIQLMG